MNRKETKRSLERDDCEIVDSSSPNSSLNESKDDSLTKRGSNNKNKSSSFNTTTSDSKTSSNTDSDSDQDANMPSGAECLKRCQQFAEITSTDKALAMFFLQNCKWDLEVNLYWLTLFFILFFIQSFNLYEQKALDRHFKSTKATNSKVVACFDINELNEDEMFELFSSLHSFSYSSL